MKAIDYWRAAKRGPALRHVWLTRLMIVLMGALGAMLHAQTAGGLDPEFGGTGRVVAVLGVPATIRAVLVQPDGKIVVVGHSSDGLNGDVILARFERRNGALDRSFGDRGIASVDFGGLEFALAAVLQPDGRILVVGDSNQGGEGNRDIIIARFLSTGQLDATFGTEGGWTRTDIDGHPDRAQAVALQPGDGKMVVAGETSRPRFPGDTSPASDFLLVRYHTNGVRDTTFGGGDGIVTTDFQGDIDRANAVFVQPDGRIVAAGFVSYSSQADTDFALARYHPDGSPDTSFGVDGWALTHFFGAGDGASAAAVQQDGKIVAAGFTLSVHPNTIDRDFAIARYDANGQLDLSFGEEGRVRTDFSDSEDDANAVVLQDDGKIVVAGSSTPLDGRPNFAIARYLPEDGRLDPEFGNGGLVTTDFSQSEDEAFAVAMQQGRIVAGGRAGPAFALARYVAMDTQADLVITKTATSPVVDVGHAFGYSLTVTNQGVDEAEAVVISDVLPQGTRFAGCLVPPDGTCARDGQAVTVSYGTLPAQESRTMTILVELDLTVADGTAIVNSASVDSASGDPDPINNVSTTTITARAVPHTLRLYLHGNDVPGTATGFTMNRTPAAAQPLALELLRAPSWFSEPALTGTFGPGAQFEVVRPCTIGLGVLVSYRLAKTNSDGGAEQLLGQATRPLGLCVGEERITIDVAAPVTLANERLRLTMSAAVGVSLTLQLGPGTYLDATDFLGVP